MRCKKVILDTNLWISFLISKRFEELDSMLEDGTIKLIFSKESIEEFLEVAMRPKFERYFTHDKIAVLLQTFDKFGQLVNVTKSIIECRDFKDNFLLSLAVESDADYLVTGDIDLLIIKSIKNTKIINWNDFIYEISH